MSQENPQSSPASSAGSTPQPSGQSGDPHAPQAHEPQPATVIVRGETVQEQDAKSASNGSPSKDSHDDDDKDDKPAKPVSDIKVKMQARLPELEDDAEIGVPKNQVITRDGKADLAFTGTLLASAAPLSAPKGKWQEYRVYETSAGKHVFSKVTRTIYAEDQDKHEAEVFDPSPSSVSSQLMKSARDLTRSKPMTWTDATANFFGYDPLAKVLYRKLGSQFEEHIS